MDNGEGIAIGTAANFFEFAIRVETENRFVRRVHDERDLFGFYATRDEAIAKPEARGDQRVSKAA